MTLKLGRAALAANIGLFCIAAASAASAQEPEVSLTPDTVLVKRGPAEITLWEFEAALEKAPEDYRAGIAADPQRLAKLLEQLAKQELLSLRAREANLQDDPEVQARLELAEKDVLSEVMLQRVRRQVEPVDYAQQAREYYLANPAEFELPERVTVQHVLISTKKHDDGEAQALAAEVAQKARSGDADFEELVRNYSEDPSASRNLGRFENVQRGQMVKPFEEAAFGLETSGDIAGPVKTEYGYHVIRLIERKPPGKRTFEQVKKGLTERLRTQHLDRAQQEYVNRMLNENELEAREPVIRALRKRYERNGKTSGDVATKSR